MMTDTSIAVVTRLMATAKGSMEIVPTLLSCSKPALCILSPGPRVALNTLLATLDVIYVI